MLFLFLFMFLPDTAPSLSMESQYAAWRNRKKQVNKLRDSSFPHTLLLVPLL